MPGNKRVMLGWMNNWDYANLIPTSPWRSAMSLPREVGLIQTADGPRLTQKAAKQVDKLGSAVSYRDKKGGAILTGMHPLPDAASGDVQRIDVTFAPGTAGKAGVTVLGDGTSSTRIGFDAARGEVFVTGSLCPGRPAHHHGSGVPRCRSRKSGAVRRRRDGPSQVTDGHPAAAGHVYGRTAARAGLGQQRRERVPALTMPAPAPVCPAARAPATTPRAGAR
jgi:hypothetical protein